MPGLGRGDLGDHAVKLAVGGWLAIAGERDVVDAAAVGGSEAKLRVLEDCTGGGVGEQFVEFPQQHGEVHRPRGRGDGAVDLAVDAVEIADLVGVQIDAHRQPATPARDDRIDIPVGLELPGVQLVQRGRFGHDGSGEGAE